MYFGRLEQYERVPCNIIVFLSALSLFNSIRLFLSIIIILSFISHPHVPLRLSPHIIWHWHARTAMHNSDPHNKNHHHYHVVSPRISFSNDFAESQYAAKQERQAPTMAASSDFEFSVSSNSMMSADELFCKGKLLPFKEKAAAKSSTTTTLREELLAGEEEGGGAGSSLRPPKGSGRWRGFLGLRKSHIGSKKADKSCEASCDSKRTAGFGPVPDNMHYHGKASQEMMRQGGSTSCRDEDMEM